MQNREKDHGYDSSKLLQGLSKSVKKDVDIDAGRIDLQTGVLSSVQGEERSDGLRYLDGIRITPFNMREEREDGAFDEDWNYTMNKREQEAKQMDAWLDEYEETHGNLPFQVSFFYYFTYSLHSISYSIATTEKMVCW